MATIKKMFRPTVFDPDTQVHAAADHLYVVVDLHSDGTCEEVVQLAFADYAGLEAEWEAGVATTVLEAAVADRLDDLVGDALTAPQRNVMDDYEINTP
ncbi:MAG TPA: hypothetical protein PLU44_16905 [Candidatus Krumholzibacteria bacterium]|nr:hypothetical protein [Candidatus Krumholzibacteria bacterium]